MAKRVTSGKREREKIKQGKRQEKQKKKEERQNKGSSSFEEMLAYVDEFGVLHSSPPEIRPMDETEVTEIQISVPRRTEAEESRSLNGRIEFFNASKGYGFVKESGTNEKYFFHITNAPAGIAEGDEVIFEAERSARGMNAVQIEIVNK